MYFAIYFFLVERQLKIILICIMFISVLCSPVGWWKASQKHRYLCRQYPSQLRTLLQPVIPVILVILGPENKPAIVTWLLLLLPREPCLLMQPPPSTYPLHQCHSTKRMKCFSNSKGSRSVRSLQTSNRPIRFRVHRCNLIYTSHSSTHLGQTTPTLQPPLRTPSKPNLSRCSLFSLPSTRRARPT